MWHYLHNASYTIKLILLSYYFVDDDEVNGPGICRLLPLARGNCWDGNNRRDSDIDEFDVDDIDGQGNNMLKMKCNNATLTLIYTYSHGSGVWGRD